VLNFNAGTILFFDENNNIMVLVSSPEMKVTVQEEEKQGLGE
jgi:hypothetical protein